MWGRVSISTPTKPALTRAAPVDYAVNDGGMTGAGVAPALSSALNVMAFTHDMDLTNTGTDITKQPTPDLLINGSNVKPTTTQAPVFNQPNLFIAPTASSTKQDLEFQTTNQLQSLLTKQDGSILTLDSMKTNDIKAEDTVYRDYFQELMTLAESGYSDDPAIRDLAERAADLTGVPEIDINFSTAVKSARRMVAGAVSGLFGVAAEPPPPESTWHRDRNDHTDSDPVPESVVLGRVARARRARTASRRAPPPPPHLYVPARSMYLVASESSAVESDVPADELISSGNNSAMGSRQVEQMRAARPLCIQHATNQYPVEYSLYVIGSGSGAEVGCAAPPITKTQVKVRPRTARPRCNRVSPEPQIGSPLEPWATASLSRLSRLIRSGSSSMSTVSQSSSDSPRRY